MLFRIYFGIFICFTPPFCWSCKSVPTPTKDWWEVASFYQIYPRSFKDSDGDGIGDIKGITQVLPYLKEIGINATWLSPIFKSPMADFGYDVSDFYNIQPEYGTLEDFNDLVTEAKRLNIKIILDFVPNHSSDECDWFIKSVNRVSGFEDFYVWHPGYEDPKNTSNRLPPSNWLSVFRGSAWKWHDVRKEFYLHQFLIKQPDLNYRNPKVKEALKDVLKYWMDRGADGFRIDAVPHIVEIDKDVTGKYKDEPLAEQNAASPDDWNYLKHIYTLDQNETIQLIYDWREFLDDYQRKNGGDTRILLAEITSSIETVMKYYGDGKRNGAHIPFNFVLLSRINNASTAFDYKSAIDYWMQTMPKDKAANWVVGNHDSARVASRLGTNRIDLINMIVLTLPGASVNYNGEELGMTNVWISWNDTIDTSACNSDPQNYEKYSRDPERTPFQWDDSTSAGFSNNSKTWLPVAVNYKEVNVAVERANTRSHLHLFIGLQQLRQQKSFQNGNYKVFASNDSVLAIVRDLWGYSSYITLINIAGGIESVNLGKLIVGKSLPPQLECVILSGNSPKRQGEKVSRDGVILQSYESLVLKF